MIDKRKRYPNEFKLEIVKLVEEQNQSPTEISKEYNIAPSTLGKWLTRYRQEVSGFAPKTGKAISEEQQELQRLRKENAQLKLACDILKKASALLARDQLKIHR